METRFWAAVNRLIEASEIKIDRPKGSPHPHHSSVIYPLDYGFLVGTSSGDQSGIDVWVGNAKEQEVTAVICTIDLDKADAEIKILIGCTQKDIAEIMAFHNQGSQSAILLEQKSARFP